MVEQDQIVAGLVIHGTGPNPEVWLPNAMRSALNAVADLGEGHAVELVVQGPAVALLTAAEGPAGQLTVLLERGVTVSACANSMRSAGVGAQSLAPGVGVVSSAVGHLARRQWDGWAYVRI